MAEVRQRRVVVSAQPQQHQQQNKHQHQPPTQTIQGSSSRKDIETTMDEHEPFLKSQQQQQQDESSKHDSSFSSSSLPPSSDPLDGHTIIPLIQRSIFFRLDVWPFVVFYFMAVMLDRMEVVVVDDIISKQNQQQQFQWFIVLLKRIFLPSVLLAHVTLALLQQWRVSVKCVVGYRRVNHTSTSKNNKTNVSKKDDDDDSKTKQQQQPIWTHCLVTAAKTAADGHAPFSAICPVVIQKSSASSSSKKGKRVVVSVVSFQDTIFRAVHSDTTTTTTTKMDIHLDSNNNVAGEDDPDMDQIWQMPTSIVSSSNNKTSNMRKGEVSHIHMKNSVESTNNNQTCKPRSLFHRLRYPDTMSFAFYKSWRGHDLRSALQAHKVYGSNQTELQLPPFSELLGEQLLAPFFLFQVFCVGLWSLDEYWYYALFTLLALLLFESTVAYNRLKGVERLRGTLRHAYPVLVYRHASWIRIMSNELVPGDVVSLLSSFAGGAHYQFQQQQQQQQPHPHVPADVLLLRGSAVVDESLLTGESVPQLKDAIDLNLKDEGGKKQRCLDAQEDKQQILFGGTILVSHDGGTQNNNDTDDSKTNIPASTTKKKSAATTRNEEIATIPQPPNGGITCFVLRTGFETAQGSLIRTMAHSSKQSADGIHTRDTFMFVVMLLCCAIASAMMVLLDGWKDETRNRFRLVLHVIIIITSVVPPELPMELSLAVTNSVADLMKRCRVFCTEPFRIPWAGKVDMCCFDKTGTLTSDKMQLAGVFVKGGKALVTSVDDLEWPVVRIMVACQSLAVRHVGNNRNHQIEVVGDPLEQAILRDTGYRLERNDFVIATGQSDATEERPTPFPKCITIRHRFAFTSRLKRMTVLASEDSNPSIWALSKGAPETMKQFFQTESIPDDYDDISARHMRLGQRVLAMGYRCFGSSVSILELKEKGRDYVEREFVFGGFLVLDCPLKPDSQSVIAELKHSGHDVVMITGDAVLTAVEVARQVGIIQQRADKSSSPTFELTELEQVTGGHVLSKFSFVALDPAGGGHLPLLPPLSDIAKLKQLVDKGEISLCASGTVLMKVASAVVLFHESKTTNRGESAILNEKNVLLHPAAQSVLKDIVPLISVFARHAPRQKEAVIAAFNLAGFHTLMCGDGTNDVGALKRAHVGISIISAPEVEEKQREATQEIARVKAADKRERKAQKKKQQSSTKSSSKSSSRSRNASLAESLRKLREVQEELDHVELGDASIASPFTSRAVSIVCCKDVLQQGRCTLVTMLQIYKILGINCLVNALVLSKLFLHGVKQGDRQMTFLGICVASLFLFVTQAKPLPNLAPIRPPSSVLCVQAILSIFVQFAIHFAAIMLATEVSLAFVDPFDPSMIPDGSFNPNILNTSTFLLTMVATINTFAVNYRGRPFMQSLSDNKLMIRSLQIIYGALIVCSLELFPPLNDLLQLAPMPYDTLDQNEDDFWISQNTPLSGIVAIVRYIKFPFFISLLMIIDTGCSFLAERSIVRLFEHNQAKC